MTLKSLHVYYYKKIGFPSVPKIKIRRGKLYFYHQIFFLFFFLSHSFFFVFPFFPFFPLFPLFLSFPFFLLSSVLLSFLSKLFPLSFHLVFLFLISKPEAKKNEPKPTQQEWFCQLNKISLSCKIVNP